MAKKTSKSFPSSKVVGPGVVKVVLHDLRKTGSHENIRVVAGVELPLLEGEESSVATATAAHLASQQLRLRFSQIFRTQFTKPAGIDKVVRPGTMVYAAVSRLVPTADYENVRADMEVGFYVGEGETIWAAFERAFTDLSVQLKAVLALHNGENSEKGVIKNGDDKASTFTWNS